MKEVSPSSIDPSPPAPAPWQSRHVWMLTLALVLGLGLRVWMIANAETIARDGAYYISVARSLEDDPKETIRQSRTHPLYPAAIAGAHWLLEAGGISNGLTRWELAGGLVSLFAGLLATVAIWLYAGRMFDWSIAGVTVLLLSLGRKWAVLGADVLTDSTALCFTMWAIVLALWATDALQARGRWTRALGASAGACVGLGYLTRPEAMVAGMTVLVFWTVWAIRRPGTRWPTFRTALAAMAAFLVVALPYVIIVGRVTPKSDVLDRIFSGPAAGWAPIGMVSLAAGRAPDTVLGSAEQVIGRFFEAMHPILGGLVCVWVVAWAIGKRTRLTTGLARRPCGNCALLTGLTVAVFGMAMFVYCLRMGVLSHRYMMLPAALACPLAGAGLMVIADAAGRAHRRAGTGAQRRAAVTVILTGGLALVMAVRSARPIHENTTYVKAAAEFVRAQVGSTGTMIADDRRILHYSQVDGYFVSPTEADQEQLVDLLYRRRTLVAVLSDKTLAAVGGKIARGPISDVFRPVEYFFPPGKETRRLGVYRIDRPRLADLRPMVWNFDGDLPTGWTYLPGVELDQGANGGLLVTTVASSRQYQVWSPRLALPQGRYELRLSTDHREGDVSLGIENTQGGRWIAHETFVGNSQLTETLVLDFELTDPAITRISLSNASITDQSHLWLLRRVELVRLGPAGPQTRPGNEEAGRSASHLR